MVSFAADQESVAKLPFVKRLPDRGRTLQLLPFYDDVAKEWWMALPNGSGGVDAGKLVGLSSGAYQAAHAANAATGIQLRGPERSEGLVSCNIQVGRRATCGRRRWRPRA